MPEIYRISIFIIIFLIFIPIVWKVLLATNLARFFKQGSIWQIRIAYIIVTLVVSELLTQVVERIFSIFFYLL